ASASKEAIERGALPDVLPKVKVRDSAVYLPFDPAEVIDNLRLERYVEPRSEKKLLAKLAHNAYYSVRPWLGASLRRRLQRLALRRWQGNIFPKWPVDRSVDRLFEKLLALSMDARQVNKIPFLWFWPNGYSSCAVMTHDVETKTGLDFCSQLMAIDDLHGIKASYQLVPEKRYAIPGAMLQAIREDRCEVNIHDLNHDGQLFRDREQFLRRATRINEHASNYSAKGFRSGALYRNSDWYGALSQFSYDMSIPNVAHLDPQRGGCCTAMPFFIGDMLELPLTTTQDYSLFHILRDYSIDLWQQQVSLIMDNHGFISFNIHPDYVIESRARAVYISLLQYLSQLRNERKLWMPLPGEVATWWRERSRMKLVHQNGSWQIEGSGKERARIAYACLTDGAITIAR
ncbi:MAG TPA: hypothetical protein VNE63_16890, partial [Candidatus Acidoferrales bacterium]|nr:hypothetical protein [Candidatus Acidoferrales bacterium]